MDISSISSFTTSLLFDVSFVSILIISGVLAAIRGFVYEVLALISWILSLMLALYLYPILIPFIMQYITIKLAAQTVTSLGLLIACYLFTSVFIHSLSTLIGKNHLDTIDRTLGFVFGIIRGFLFVCILGLFCQFILSPQIVKEWVPESKTKYFVEKGIIFIKNIAPYDIIQQTKKHLNQSSVYPKLFEPLEEPSKGIDF